MSAELGPQSSERSSENTELQKLGAERLKELAETSSEKPAVDSEKRAEAAREMLKTQEVQAPEPVAKETGNEASFIKRISHGLGYADTMTSVQRRLNPASPESSTLLPSRRPAQC